MSTTSATARLLIVASGFGSKAQWLRNIEANPRVRIYAGIRARRRHSACARPA